jgi:hypothetical protein
MAARERGLLGISAAITFLPDALVLAVAKLLPMQLRNRRLFHFGRMLHFGPQFLPRLVAAGAPAAGSWVELVLQDLQWFRGAEATFAATPEPRQDPRAWCQFVLQDLGLWKRKTSSCFAREIEDA